MSFVIAETSRMLALGMSRGDSGAPGGLVVLDIEVQYPFRADMEPNLPDLLRALFLYPCEGRRTALRLRVVRLFLNVAMQ